uniref:Uncharacterized protein n=1 Tax=Rhizophora mucronata TaxID=61149 RepID=A0A2P2Q2T2_RHIMU
MVFSARSFISQVVCNVLSMACCCAMTGFGLYLVKCKFFWSDYGIT